MPLACGSPNSNLSLPIINRQVRAPTGPGRKHFTLDTDFFLCYNIRLKSTTDIPLQEGEEIIWKGKAQLPGQAVHEYIPMLILVLIYANSLHLRYPVEPLSMLHEFCSGNLAGGILLTGIVLFAHIPADILEHYQENN